MIPKDKHNKNIVIIGAAEHNLKAVDVQLPRGTFIVVTGVSGSGKSSLAFDTIAREGQRRYLSSWSTYARQFIGKMGRPDVEHINGLGAALSIDQKTTGRSSRSTVGTMSDIYDHLRLLFARLGQWQGNSVKQPTLNQSLFSFNTARGACPDCKGRGVVDRVDPELLVEDSSKTLREGALVITTPSGYLVYSQVTMDVLNEVLNAHEFNVDIPWRNLSDEQKSIVLFGSNIIKIPYGKHTLESRLKWSGITVRPREEGYYKGIVPVIEEILKRDRNKNALRFARSMTCGTCLGTRLCKDALNVHFNEKCISDYAAFSISKLNSYFGRGDIFASREDIGSKIAKEICDRAALLERLGLGYLTLDRESTTLCGGELQRIRLAVQVGGRLRGVVYVLDEPSIGLHPHDNQRLLEILHELKAQGNTVVVVEHDEETIKAADWLVDVGPAAGQAGGEIVYSGPLDQVLNRDSENSGVLPTSPTLDFLRGNQNIAVPKNRRVGNGGALSIYGARQFNLKDIDVEFKLNAFNVVTGVSGAGKSTLVERTLGRALRSKLNGDRAVPGEHNRIEGIEQVHKIVEIDHAPIGRTPRSNPATYTKLFDRIRELYAQSPEAKAHGWNKGHFSFNTRGGRCERCEGAGVIEIGMQFLDNVQLVCPRCAGRRFDEETLAVLLHGKNIHEVLEMSVEHAAIFFKEDKKVCRFLDALIDVGLQYISLGQPSATLSGGEGQRVKLATQLARPTKGNTLYILDEPTTGLHIADIEVLLKALGRLVDAGHTVIAIEHNLEVIKVADWVLDLGPGSGSHGGELVIMGTPEQVVKEPRSFTGHALKTVLSGFKKKEACETKEKSRVISSFIELRGVRTNNLKDLNIDIPHGKITVVTGVSGSGKSSLALGTIYAEGQRCFSRSISTYARRFLKQVPAPPARSISGISPTIAVGQERSTVRNPRSTVGTATEIYDHYRLLYSRAGIGYCPLCDTPLNRGKCPKCQFMGEEKLTSSMFSFSSERGACKCCSGLGVKRSCSPDKLVSDPRLPLFHGAMDGHKTGAFYGETGGQYRATLCTVGKNLGYNYDIPFCELGEEARRVAMYGAGEEEFEVVWRYNRKGRQGEHVFKSCWVGLVELVNQEYTRKHSDRRGEKIEVLMRDTSCPECQGTRLAPQSRSVRYAGKTICELSALSVAKSILFFKEIESHPDKHKLSAFQIEATVTLRAEILRRHGQLKDLALSYLFVDRQMSSLSGGEAQRIKLASGLGAQLHGITYVLDEPTVGLHPRDVEHLIETLRALRDQGNTLVVVEHDDQLIGAADHIVDIGPGAAGAGGQVVAQGRIEKIKACKESITGAHLAQHNVFFGSPRSLLGKPPISIRNAHLNNLKNIDLKMPRGGIIAVTGVSGSGKSTLVFDVMLASKVQGEPVGCLQCEGIEKTPLVAVNQHPPGGTSAGCLATYLKVFDSIRALFAKTELAKKLRLTKKHFSFNSKGGRCEACAGQGRNRVALDFLGDAWIPCEECGGKRYMPNVLACKFEGHSIFEILEMDAAAAAQVFAKNPKIIKPLEMAVKMGVGYLPLGRPLTTISGGEAQRLKLAYEMFSGESQDNASCVYLFDEPTTGLHASDVGQLINVFETMVEAGHTVVVIEHNPQLICRADWVIDLGPEGGDAGGDIVAQGTPEEISRNYRSYTGSFLLKENSR
jgi:excinuclease ABC subunit A